MAHLQLAMRTLSQTVQNPDRQHHLDPMAQSLAQVVFDCFFISVSFHSHCIYVALFSSFSDSYLLLLFVQRVWGFLGAARRVDVEAGQVHLLGTSHAVQAMAWEVLGSSPLAALHADLGVQVYADEGKMPCDESCLVRCQAALQRQYPQALKMLLQVSFACMIRVFTST